MTSRMLNFAQHPFSKTPVSHEANFIRNDLIIKAPLFQSSANFPRIVKLLLNIIPCFTQPIYISRVFIAIPYDIYCTSMAVH